MRIRDKIHIQWQDFAGLLMALLFLLLATRIVVPAISGELYNVYGFALIMLAMGVYLSQKGMTGPWEIKLLFALVVWVLLTRWANKDLFLKVDAELVKTVCIYFLFFAVCFCLKGKRRELALDIASIIYGGIIVLGSMASIFILLTNTYFRIPPNRLWITTYQEGSMVSLLVFSTIRLISAPRFFAGWGLLLYQIAKRKNLIVRILLILCTALVHMTIAFFHSRTTQLAMTACYFMVVILLLMQLMQHKALKIKLPVLALAGVLTLVLAYGSFSASIKVIEKLSPVISAKVEEKYYSSETVPDTAYFGIRQVKAESTEKAKAYPQKLRASSIESKAEAVPLSMSDNRKLAGNWTFTGRTDIWLSAFYAIKEKPVIGLVGSLTEEELPRINRILVEDVKTKVVEYKTHMHNAWIEILVLTGIPGFLLTLAWSVMLIIKMLKLYFDGSGKFKLWQKMLTVPLTGLIIINIMEPSLFAVFEISSVVFYIMAGTTLSYFYELN